MPQSAVQQIKPPVQRFVFTEENTIGDLFEKVNELEKAGKPPFLKFLGTRGQIVAAEVLVEDHETETIELTQAGRSALDEMGVAGHEDDAPDPAVVPVPDSEKVWFDGHLTTWGTLSQNERMTCSRNERGRLVGGYPL